MIIEMIQAKRREYTLSLENTAILLSITMQTILNWLNGTTRRCNLLHRNRVIRLISGQMDYLLKSQQSSKLPSLMANEDWTISNVFRFRRQAQHLIRLFQYAAQTPDVNEQFIFKLEKLCRKALNMMKKSDIASCPGKTKVKRVFPQADARTSWAGLPPAVLKENAKTSRPRLIGAKNNRLLTEETPLLPMEKDIRPSRPRSSRGKYNDIFASETPLLPQPEAFKTEEY